MLREALMAGALHLAAAASAGAAARQDSGPASAPPQEKLRASDLIVGVRIEAKVEEAPEGWLRVLDLELAPPDGRDSVTGPVRFLGERRFTVLGVRVDWEVQLTEWLDADGRAITPDTLPADSDLKADLSRGTRIARRVRRVEAGRRRTLVGAIELAEAADHANFRLVVLGRELRLPARLKVDVPADLQGAPLTSLKTTIRSVDRKGRRKFEDTPRGLLRFGDWGTLGGTLEWRGQARQNPTLDPARDRDEVRSGYKARLEFTAKPGEDLLVVAGIQAAFEARSIDGKPNESDYDVRLGETFVQQDNAFGVAGLSGLVGRSLLQDDREWLFNRQLDGVRVFLDRGAWNLEASVVTGIGSGSSYDNGTVNFLGLATLDVGARSTVSGYVIDRRDDDSSDVSPFYYGLRSGGRPLREVSYWAELAGVAGVEGSNKLAGFGADVGATYTLPGALKPNFTIGFAYGTGDDDPNDRTDTRFRQTGWQKNNDRFAGVTSFRYYGEVLDPELSNLQVLTVGTGARLFERTSIDLVAHRYFQAEADAFLRNTNLKASPNGRSRDLGWGIDAVLGIREAAFLDIEIATGLFVPGSAFDTHQTAYIVRLDFRFKF